MGFFSTKTRLQELSILPKVFGKMRNKRMERMYVQDADLGDAVRGDKKVD